MSLFRALWDPLGVLRLRRASLQPSVITLNHLIVCCSSAKEARRGLELFEEVEVEANLVTFNALIACCKKGKLRSQAR